jgi:hypothetical protein
MQTITITNQVTKVTATVTIPADASIRPSGAKFKATNSAGLSSFFAEIEEAAKYANGQQAQHSTWTGAIYGR